MLNRYSLPRCLFCLVALIILVPLTGTAQSQSADAPDPLELARRGKNTASRFANESATWTSVVELPNTTVEVVTTRSNGARDSTASLVRGSLKQKLARILERDGYWYVQYENHVGKYRPYEAPLPLPATYLFLKQSEPKLVVDGRMLAAARFDSLQKNIARYHVPIAESARQQLRQSLSAIDRMQQENPGRVTPELAKMVPQMRDTLENGAVLEIDTDSGLIMSSGTTANRCTLRDFRWLPKGETTPLPAEFDNAQDLTRPITETAASLVDLLMIGHADGWEPGGPKIDTDAVIVNARTGDIRRVPYPATTLSSGCFAKDRRSVFISGHVPDAGNLALFQVDLTTGTFRPIAEAQLSGITMFPTLSPDGKILAVINKNGQGANILESQVCLIELATGRVSKIGSPMDTAFLSWLPDQSGVLLVTREKRDMDSHQKNTIAKLDLGGQITPIRPGAFPIVIPDRQRILFLNEDDGLWRTCDMTGKDETMIGNGLKEFGFPALSPDGKWLLMMRFAKSTGPRPYFVDLATGQTTAVVVGKGLWVLPTWR